MVLPESNHSHHGLIESRSPDDGDAIGFVPNHENEKRRHWKEKKNIAFFSIEICLLGYGVTESFSNKMLPFQIKRQNPMKTPLVWINRKNKKLLIGSDGVVVDERRTRSRSWRSRSWNGHVLWGRTAGQRSKRLHPLGFHACTTASATSASACHQVKLTASAA